jgi:hypothetical protein
MGATGIKFTKAQKTKMPNKAQSDKISKHKVCDFAKFEDCVFVWNFVYLSSL